MISGYKFIRELGKKGLRGQFFSYENYKKIGKISKFENLKSYIQECGFNNIDNATNEKELVTLISQETSSKAVKFFAIESIFWLFLSLFGGCS